MTPATTTGPDATAARAGGGGRVVVGVDGSAGADAAAAWAAGEAAARGWRVERVTVADGDPLVDGPGATRAAEGLLEAARGAELLVVGARGRGGFRGLLLGSVGQRCIEGASVPVVVVRGDPGGPGAPVVVGVDGSPDSERALRWALARGATVPGPLQLVHAWQPPDLGADPVVFAQRSEADARRRAEAVVAAARASVPDDERWAGRVAVAVPTGRPDRVLGEQARGAALVVVGARGLGRVRALLGSVSSRLARHAPCPLVVVPPGDGA